MLKAPYRRYLRSTSISHVDRDREDTIEPSSDTFASNPWDFRRWRSYVADTSEALEGESLGEPLEGGKKTAGDLVHDNADADDKEPAVQVHSTSPPAEHHSISHTEWLKLSRATRNTSWSVVSFLITTDMFGPLSVPYGPSVSVYTVIGALAGS
ncbi:hypothetical protein AYO21_04974 [Fonsecaea monophora]|uniref:Uncharacterized protein n=1 Tax=Fonsecaea monophora TaxID=254056 RepID=A0A177F9H0_9EURO|nr:hypothetical protein AYO21_04974 [Fonsecaea monophora]OAG40897.1 hypothetical protein AYO21_04974 [Fonsecaea monophora]